jgi:Uma2 family endonuclease
MKAAVRKRKPAPAESYTEPLVLRTRPVLDLTDDQFLAVCQLNRDLRIERNAEGDWLIMPPAGGETGSREAEITFQLSLWAKRDRTGLVYSPSAGFRLANTAVRAPDAAWVLRSRLDAIPAEQQKKFLPLCPDFVLELRSPTDRLADVQAKMAEYLANGARLGWLLDPEPRQVYVYRPEAPVARLDRPETVAGDPELPGFVLDLREIW